MLAVGNDELITEIKKGDIVFKGTLKGAVEYGTDLAGNQSEKLGFINTGKDSYLVCINNKLLPGWSIE